MQHFLSQMNHTTRVARQKILSFVLVCYLNISNIHNTTFSRSHPPTAGRRPPEAGDASGEGGYGAQGADWGRVQFHMGGVL